MTHPLADRMAAQIDRWEQAADRRAIFLACYARMTDQMIAAVAAGRFHDAAWVATLIERFADYYFVALADWERGAPTPEVWRQAHALAAEPTTTVAQNLLMGVNAHINCDLVLVLDDLLRPEWGALGPAARAARQADYDEVNLIIGETIDCVQDTVVARYARAMGLVDQALGPLDEWCTARLIRNWRDDVWRRALATIDAPEGPARAAARAEADRVALARGRLLVVGGTVGARVFGYPLRWLHRLRVL